jgi:hypothetical protein
MKFIQKIQEATTAKVEVFGGLVVLECKILSPLEAEAAGLASSLVASSVLDPNQLKKLARRKQILERAEAEDAGEEDLEQLLNLMQGFDPAKLMKIEEHQNRILKQVVIRASEDGGETFEDLVLVDSIEEQDAENNQLWVGAIPKEDRNKIMSIVMNHHKEVADHLQTFQG